MYEFDFAAFETAINENRQFRHSETENQIEPQYEMVRELDSIEYELEKSDCSYRFHTAANTLQCVKLVYKLLRAFEMEFFDETESEADIYCRLRYINIDLTKAGSDICELEGDTPLTAENREDILRLYNATAMFCKKMLGENKNREFLAMALMGFYYAEVAGDAAKAVETFENLYEQKKSVLGANHPRLALDLYWIGYLHIQNKDVEKIREVADRMVTIAKANDFKDLNEIDSDIYMLKTSIIAFEELPEIECAYELMKLSELMKELFGNKSSYVKTARREYEDFVHYMYKPCRTAYKDYVKYKTAKNSEHGDKTLSPAALAKVGRKLSKAYRWDIAGEVYKELYDLRKDYGDKVLIMLAKAEADAFDSLHICRYYEIEQTLKNEIYEFYKRKYGENNKTTMHWNSVIEEDKLIKALLDEKK